MTNEPAGQKIVKPSAEGIAAAARQVKSTGPAPVHLWDPPFCGDLDMRIARDGTWFYLGTPIGRQELVRLFSGVIRKDGEDFFLVTPVEKVGITVDDAPFVAVDFDVENPGNDQCIRFTTNVGDIALASSDLPIKVVRDPQTGEPSPYVRVRANLDALIDRKSFYRLVEIGTHEAVGEEKWFGLRSCGDFFPVIPSAELP